MSNEVKQEVVVSKKPRTEITEPPETNHLFGGMEEVERMMNRLMPRSWMSPMSWHWPMWPGMEENLASVRIPNMDVIDRDHDVLIHVEMPGVDKKDVDVSVSNSTLHIKGCISQQTHGHRKDLFRCEIAQGNFARNLKISTGIDKTKISAMLKDGILEITLPKEVEAQRRNVEIV